MYSLSYSKRNVNSIIEYIVALLLSEENSSIWHKLLLQPCSSNFIQRTKVLFHLELSINGDTSLQLEFLGVHIRCVYNSMYIGLSCSCGHLLP